MIADLIFDSGGWLYFYRDRLKMQSVLNQGERKLFGCRYVCSVIVFAFSYLVMQVFLLFLMLGVFL